MCHGIKSLQSCQTGVLPISLPRQQFPVAHFSQNDSISDTIPSCDKTAVVPGSKTFNAVSPLSLLLDIMYSRQSVLVIFFKPTKQHQLGSGPPSKPSMKKIIDNRQEYENCGVFFKFLDNKLCYLKIDLYSLCPTPKHWRKWKKRSQEI